MANTTLNQPCTPKAFERQLDTILEAPAQPAGRPLAVILRSVRPFAAFANDTWLLSIAAPGSGGGAAVLVGPMAAWRFYNDEYQWRLDVPATLMQKASWRIMQRTQGRVHACAGACVRVRTGMRGAHVRRHHGMQMEVLGRLAYLL